MGPEASTPAASQLPARNYGPREVGGRRGGQRGNPRTLGASWHSGSHQPKGHTDHRERYKPGLLPRDRESRRPPSWGEGALREEQGNTGRAAPDPEIRLLPEEPPTPTWI